MTLGTSSHVASGMAARSPLIEGVDMDKEDSNGHTPLDRATIEGDVSAVKAMIAAGASVGLSSGRGTTAQPLLHIAARYGNVGVMRVLLEHGADANKATAWGSTALHIASEENQVDAIEFLLVEAGACASKQNSTGQTPLHDASIEGASGAIVALLRHGADACVWDDFGYSPLHLAAKKGHASVVNAICDAGADVDLRMAETRWTRSRRGYDFCALELAAQRGHVDAMQALIRHGANMNAVNSAGSTALYQAAWSNRVGAIDVLVAAGADVNGQDDSSHIPLHAATNANSSEAICALARHGADLYAKDDKDDTALMSAASERHCVGSIDALVAAGVDPNLAYDGWSPLMRAAYHEQIPCVYKLIQCGAAVDWSDDEEVGTALTIAVYNCLGDSEVIDALIEAGADVNSSKGRWTPLQMACQSETGLVTIPILLRHGADVNLPGDEGSSPLHWAVRRRCGDEVFRECVPVEAVDLLLRAGADETAVDEDGLTPTEQLLCEILNGLGFCEGAGRVLELLIRAPADRAWRRRGMLLLCRAYQHKALLEPRGGRSKMQRAGRGSIERDGDPVERDAAREEAGAREFRSVLAWLFEVEEEGIFRRVVCFL